MDRSLIEAAQTGDVDCLVNLIKNNPLILRTVALFGGDTPLHIATTAGRLNFVKELLKLRREFAAELNQDGFSPLHIASANGDIEIVKELLEADERVCRIKGREGRIALHYAVIKGRVVIRELLSACADSVENATARGETALHLAVKNNQFEAFKVLVEHLMQHNKQDVLNNKEEHAGNTVLHLAVSRKQHETRLQSSLQRRLRSSSSPSSDTTPELSSDTTSKLFFALEDYPVNITCPRLHLKVQVINYLQGLSLGGFGFWL